MNLRAFAAAAVTGATVLFSWQLLASFALPWRAGTPTIGLPMQGAADLVAASALCLFFSLLPDRTPRGIAKAVALVAFAAVLVKETATSGATIHGLVNVLEQTASLILAGLATGLVMRKLDPDAGVSIPEGQGYYRTSGGRKTIPR